MRRMVVEVRLGMLLVSRAVEVERQHFRNALSKRA